MHQIRWHCTIAHVEIRQRVPDGIPVHSVRHRIMICKSGMFQFLTVVVMTWWCSKHTVLFMELWTTIYICCIYLDIWVVCRFYMQVIVTVCFTPLQKLYTNLHVLSSHHSWPYTVCNVGKLVSLPWIHKEHDCRDCRLSQLLLYP